MGFTEKKTSWSQNFPNSSTLGELISKLSEYFCFGLFLEQSLGSKVIGKKYEVIRGIPETHETQSDIFSLRIFPEGVLDLPGSSVVPLNP